MRLLLPGWEGNANVKWLRRLKVSPAPSMTKDETSKYTDLMPDGQARQFTFPMEVKSVITSPCGGQTMQGPGLYKSLVSRGPVPGGFGVSTSQPMAGRVGRRRPCRIRSCPRLLRDSAWRGSGMAVLPS